MPPRSNLPTPDSISGERSIGTPYADLLVKARPVDTYTRPVGSQIQDIPTENPLAQLGAALKDFNPTLSKVLGQQAEYREEEQRMSGEEMGKRLSAARVKVAAAVKSGFIKPGVSRAYLEAANATELKYAAMEHAAGIRTAWDASPAKQSDDPDAYRNFAAEYNQTFRTKTLMEGENPRYSMRELAYSKFDDTLAGNTNSLLSQHIEFRADARTKRGVEMIQLQAGQTIDNIADPEKPETFQLAAQKMMADTWDSVTGVAAQGLPHDQVNHKLIDTVAQRMIQYNDPTYRQIAELMVIQEGPAKGQSIGKTAYALNKFKETEDAMFSEKIRRTNWKRQEEEAEGLEEGGFGPKEQGRARARENKRHEATAKHTEIMRDKATREEAKNVETESRMSAVLNSVREGTINNSPMAKEALKWLDQNDASKSMVIHNYLEAASKQGGHFVDTKESALAEGQMRFQMSENPMSFNSSEILIKATNGTINPAHINSLLDDWDKAKLHVENPFLQNEGFKELRNGLKMAVLGDSPTPTAEDKARAIKVSQQLTEVAYDWIDSNPKGDYRTFLKEMRSQVDPLTIQFAPELSKDAQRKQEKITSPKPQPQKDTRSAFEKVAPNFAGGKDAPAPVTPAAGPPPLTDNEIRLAFKPEIRERLIKMVGDPNTDEIQMSAAIHNSGLWPWMKANGRTVAEYQTIHDRIIAQRGKKK